MSETVINLGSTQYYVLEAFRQLGAMPEVDSKENLQQFMCGYIPLHSGNSVNTKGQTTISLQKRQHTVLMCMGPALLSQQHMLLGVSMLNSCTQSLTVDVRIKCFIFFCNIWLRAEIINFFNNKNPRYSIKCFLKIRTLKKNYVRISYNSPIFYPCTCLSDPV